MTGSMETDDTVNGKNESHAKYSDQLTVCLFCCCKYKAVPWHYKRPTAKTFLKALE